MATTKPCLCNGTGIIEKPGQEDYPGPRTFEYCQCSEGYAQMERDFAYAMGKQCPASERR